MDLMDDWYLKMSFKSRVSKAFELTVPEHPRTSDPTITNVRRKNQAIHLHKDRHTSEG